MSNPTKYYSNIQEKTIANALNWEIVVASGSRSFYPGDIQSSMWLGECKTHTSPGNKILFSKHVWDKLRAEAISKFRYPVYFCDDGSQSLNSTWALYPDTVRSRCVEEHFPLVRRYTINVTMALDELQKQYVHAVSLKKPNTEVVIMDTILDMATVHIVPFKTFKEMFGD